MSNKFKKEIICLNCNNAGHVQKNCKYPLNSYGIILFKKDKFNNHKFLLIQRKFSYSFMSLFLAKYYDMNIINETKLISIIKLIPINERYLIITYNFDKLWKNVWTWENMIDTKYDELKNKFQLFKEEYIQLFDIFKTSIIEPEWEFPKGRRVIGESNIQCAIRECLEETNILPDKIYENKIFHEKFTGTDGIVYCNNYFISKQTNDDNIYYDCDEHRQNSEIRKIGWFNTNDCLKLLNNTDYKRKILQYICRS